MSELKPCPFCGSENIAVGSDKGTVYRRNTAFGDLTRSVPTVRWAYCVDCGCVAPAEKVNNFDGFYKPDEQEDALNRAISAWNRRAQQERENQKPQWISVKDRLPDKLEPVNIVWVNRKPERYYAEIKDKPFVATGYYWNDKWWWYSATCEDYLAEYGHSDCDEVDEAIEITHWMPLPEPPKEAQDGKCQNM